MRIVTFILACLIATVPAFGAVKAPVSPKIYFSTAPSQSMSITDWRIDGNGAWVKQPVITLNGRTYKYATPQEYVVALQKIQRFYRGHNIQGFDTYISASIRQFQAIKTTGTSTTVVTPTTTTTVTTPSITGVALPGVIGTSVDFGTVDTTSEAAVARLGGPYLTVGTTTYYAGYTSSYPNNRNARLLKFTSGSLVMDRSDYETSNDISTMYGLMITLDGRLYGVFSTTGATDAGKDFNRFTRGGWIDTYGAGSATVAVLAELDPTTGSVLRATYLSSRLSSGTTTGLAVTSLRAAGSGIEVLATAAWSPRNVSGQPMFDDKYIGSSTTFAYSVELTSDLKKAVSAKVVGGGAW